MINHSNKKGGTMSSKNVSGSPDWTKDNWDKAAHPNLKCATCHSYINFRCRRHAPKGQEGWPAVFPTDWCMDHKMSKQAMEQIGGQ
jgi:hypothetical protein